MAEELLEKARELVDAPIDFEGQRLAELLSNTLLIIAGLAAFFAGYITQNVYNSVYVGLAGTALVLLVVVPPWPFYNQHPASWLPSSKVAGVGIQVDGKKMS